MRKTTKSTSPTESALQISFLQYVFLQKVPTDPAWENIAASPNQGKRSLVAGRRMKAEGMRKGFPDLAWYYPAHGYHGLFVELKRPKGRLRPEQIEWINRLNKQGYLAGAFEAYDFMQIVRIFEAYQSGTLRQFKERPNADRPV